MGFTPAKSVWAPWHLTKCKCPSLMWSLAKSGHIMKCTLKLTYIPMLFEQIWVSLWPNQDVVPSNSSTRPSNGFSIVSLRYEHKQTNCQPKRASNIIILKGTPVLATYRVLQYYQPKGNSSVVNLNGLPCYQPKGGFSFINLKGFQYFQSKGSRALSTINLKGPTMQST